MNSYFAILPIFSAFLCIVLGLFTFTRNPRHPANIGFLLGMINLAIVESGNAMVLFSNAEWQTALPGIRLAMRGEAALPATWLLFSIVFAKANYKQILSKWVPVLFGTAIISLFFIVWVVSPSFISSQSLGIFTLGVLGWYFYLYLLLGFVLNLVNIENTLRSSSSAQRRKIKFIIFGVGSIFAFFVYLSSQALLFSTINIRTIPLLSVVILVSTSLMALSIVKHRLLSVDIYISRHVVYNSVTVFIVGLYLLAVGLITQGVKYFHIPFNYFFVTLFIFISILALVILLYTDTFRRKVLVFINRHFYRHKYDFRLKWMETIERISSKRSIDEIQRTLTEMITESMGARVVYLWLYEPVSKNYIAYHNALTEGNDRVSQFHSLFEHIKANMSPFILRDCDESGSEPGNSGDEVSALAAATETVLCTPLVVGHEIVGFVLQGEDISGEPYVENDFEFLKTLSTQAAMQIKNVQLTQKLMTAREVDTFNKMSSFMMHDLKNLTNSLSLISQNARHNIDNPEFQRDAIRTIDTTVSRMKGLIEKLSSVPGKFELKKETVELDDVVNRAVKKAVVPHGRNVAITKEMDGVPAICIDSEAMEMVFINLLTNAYGAIEREGVVKILASEKTGNVQVTVADNGSGMSDDFMRNSLFHPFKTTKKTGFGIGLYQCKTIVDAHGGRIDVESAEGEGTTFTITLPVK